MVVAGHGGRAHQRAIPAHAHRAMCIRPCRALALGQSKQVASRKNRLQKSFVESRQLFKWQAAFLLGNLRRIVAEGRVCEMALRRQGLAALACSNASLPSKNTRLPKRPIDYSNAPSNFQSNKRGANRQTPIKCPRRHLQIPSRAWGIARPVRPLPAAFGC